MIRILILEDDIERVKLFRQNFTGCEFIFTDKVPECIKYLNENKFDYLFLDHDLGGKVFVPSDGEELTGYHVAKHLEENPSCKPVKTIFIHSFNSVGAKKMKEALPNAVLVPGVWTQKINFAL